MTFFTEKYGNTTFTHLHIYVEQKFELHDK